MELCFLPVISVQFTSVGKLQVILPAMRTPVFDPCIGKIPWRRGRLPTPVFWPEEFHGLYNPWGCKESDTSEQPSLSLSNGGGNEDNGDLLQNVPCLHCYTQCPQPCSRPLPTHASARDSWTLKASLGQSLVGSLLLSPGSWCTQRSVCALQESVAPVLCKF